MYGIFEKTPRYDNRDAVCGLRIRQVSEYVYETLALAQYMVGKHLLEDDVDCERTVFAADVNSPYKPLVKAQRSNNFSEDIPF